MKGCWMRIRWIGCNGAIEKQHNTIEALSISRVQYYPHKCRRFTRTTVLPYSSLAAVSDRAAELSVSPLFLPSLPVLQVRFNLRCQGRICLLEPLQPFLGAIVIQQGHRARETFR